MELVRQYIAAVNALIHAGADVRTVVHGESVPVIELTIDEEEQELVVTLLNKHDPFDKTTHVLLRQTFTIAFNDYPAEVKQAGWE
jgi:hypothetical protein